MESSTVHPRDVLAWHGLSGVSMLLMALAGVPGWFAPAGMAMFVAGMLWCGVHLARRETRGTYLRLAVCCLAMLVMISAPEHPSTSMPGHDMAVPGPSVLAVAMALALVAVVGSAVRRSAAPGGRGSVAAGGCEAALALAMAAMLVGLA